MGCGICSFRNHNPFAIKIAPFIKKIVFKTKNGDALAQNSDITAEAEASPITAMGKISS